VSGLTRGKRIDEREEDNMDGDEEDNTDRNEEDEEPSDG
jgi:hypothetical protein